MRAHTHTHTHTHTLHHHQCHHVKKLFTPTGVSMIYEKQNSALTPVSFFSSLMFKLFYNGSCIRHRSRCDRVHDHAPALNAQFNKVLPVGPSHPTSLMLPSVISVTTRMSVSCISLLMQTTTTKTGIYTLMIAVTRPLLFCCWFFF